MTILRAARLLKDTDVIFLFLGEGEHKSEYKRYCLEEDLDNCIFFDVQPRNVMNQIFRKADVLAHSLRKERFWEYALSSKIFEYHGSGRPIIFSGGGQIPQILREAQSGIAVEPENPEGFADAVRYLHAHRNEARRMGEAGRQWIIENYLRERIFLRWNEVLSQVRVHN